jgi:hypothetical protein
VNLAFVCVPDRPLAFAGAEERLYITGLAHALARHGQRVTIYTPAEAAQPARPQPAPTVASVGIGGRPEAFAHGLREAWAADPPDLVHAFGVGAARAAADATPPVLVVTASPPPRDSARAAFAEHHTVIRSAARVVATASSQVFALAGAGVGPAAIKFVPCGVALDSPPPPGVAGARPDRLRLAAFTTLASMAELADVSQAVGAFDDVELRVGVLDQEPIAPVVRAADIVVCVPRADAIGTVALEAMAGGVPVIASAVGALLDIVADGLTGLHVPPRSPRQLAYAIDALRGDPPRRERFGRLGVARVAARYAWPRIAADMVDVYLGAAGQAAQAGPQGPASGLSVAEVRSCS